jgi:hypothetical protein
MIGVHFRTPQWKKRLQLAWLRLLRQQNSPRYFSTLYDHHYASAVLDARKGKQS